jgi:hypothetical protein
MRRQRHSAVLTGGHDVAGTPCGFADAAGISALAPERGGCALGRIVTGEDASAFAYADGEQTEGDAACELVLIRAGHMHAMMSMKT